MANKAQNFLNSVNRNCPLAVYKSISEVFDGAPKAAVKKQGKMIKCGLEILNESGQDIKPVMRQCNCLSDSVIAQAKKCYELSDKNIPKLLKLLNDKHIGGGALYTDNKGNIIGIYDRCYCGIPKAVSDISFSYCECSAGWFEKLFESVFEHEVEVRLIHSILNGYKDCIFEINYQG